MNNDQPIREQLITAFGTSTYTANGQLDRAYLAQLVFNDKKKLEKLNGIVHPAVRADGIRWDEAQQETPYTLREAALLYESGIYQLLDQIICVTAPEELRIARVIARDNTSAEAVKARIDQQWPEEKKVALADYIIHNDGKQSLIHQVYNIHHQLVRPDRNH
jgi:dephospho-CoA kinase